MASHLTYLGDSVVGDRANLGCGTITANVRHDGANHKAVVNGACVDTGRLKLGAIIGDDVHTGINTSIYPGRKMWPGVTTRPGAIVLKDVEA
jgi:bifunctional UDP-N-acetylglucosamine pyrophosphorylase/glucosamine-1-phosphate N-acetyltransferase